MDANNSIFEINFHKINQNCGNLPESFWVDKFHAYFSTDYPLFWKFIRNLHIFNRYLIFFKWLQITLFWGNYEPQKPVWGRISTFHMSDEAPSPKFYSIKCNNAVLFGTFIYSLGKQRSHHNCHEDHISLLLLIWFKPGADQGLGKNNWDTKTEKWPLWMFNFLEWMMGTILTILGWRHQPAVYIIHLGGTSPLSLQWVDQP